MKVIPKNIIRFPVHGSIVRKFPTGEAGVGAPGVLDLMPVDALDQELPVEDVIGLLVDDDGRGPLDEVGGLGDAREVGEVDPLPRAGLEAAVLEVPVHGRLGRVGGSLTRGGGGRRGNGRQSSQAGEVSHVKDLPLAGLGVVLWENGGGGGLRLVLLLDGVLAVKECGGFPVSGGWSVERNAESRSECRDGCGDGTAKTVLLPQGRHDGCPMRAGEARTGGSGRARCKHKFRCRGEQQSCGNGASLCTKHFELVKRVEY